MTPSILLVLGTVIVGVLLFVKETLRYDVVGILVVFFPLSVRLYRRAAG